MDLHDHTISSMIAGGRRLDPAELRNRAHLQALRNTDPRPSRFERVRGYLTGSAPVSANRVDLVCCTA